jgi:uncharacterized protein with ParB-like and HNH nuclease domain
MKKIDAAIQNLKNILANDEKFYQVPDYQRPYSWEDEQLSALIEDLTDSFSREDNEYFCGSLVLVENEKDKRFDIIDGQQRITTFIILACVIRDLFKDKLNKRSLKYIINSIHDDIEEEKRKLKFLTDIKYQNDFIQTVLNGINFNIDKKSIKDNRYLLNALTLKELLEEKIKEKNITDINEFVKWLYENVVLTYISCPSQDSAIQIFNVLNDRGMPLSPVDILKSSLMHKIENDEEKRKIFKKDWESINEDISKYDDISIEDVLNAYLYYSIESNPKSRLDKELLEYFKREKKEPLKIVNEIREFTKSYIELLDMTDRYVYTLKYLKHRIYWVSILTTALFVKYPQMEELKKILVAYYYQNWIAGATVARIKQTSFKILKLVKNKENIEKIKDEIRNNLKRYNTTQTFREELQGPEAYYRKWAKPVLLMVEYFMDDAEVPSFIPMTKKLQLEHILPQNPSKYWKEIFTDEEIEKWKNSLANLTLLALRKNVQASNDSFEIKKEIYKNKKEDVITSFKLTQEILDYSKWDESALKNRKEKLFNRINQKIDIF